MTDDEIDMRIMRIMRAIARGVSHPTRHAVATTLGIIPPRYASVDAGRPMQPTRYETYDTPPLASAEDAELNRICDERKDGPFVSVTLDTLNIDRAQIASLRKEADQ